MQTGSSSTMVHSLGSHSRPTTTTSKSVCISEFLMPSRQSEAFGSCHPSQLLKTSGEMNATSFGPTCVQNFTATNPFSQSEDCLTINVYAPASIAKGAKLPVMVYVYGGNFDSGSSSNSAFNGSTLVHRSVELGQDVVVVTFNYRLGVFGFLASPEIQAAGGSNAGLKDQVAAFRWVRKNSWTLWR
ncbi:Carboxylesterase family-domain-containing protein [Zopfochytrium polystomum]|nr:Carboxylesterase family-domain-containing protein [Zopfochytrium polystomum]